MGNAAASAPPLNSGSQTAKKTATNFLQDDDMIRSMAKIVSCVNWFCYPAMRQYRASFSNPGAGGWLLNNKTVPSRILYFGFGGIRKKGGGLAGLTGSPVPCFMCSPWEGGQVGFPVTVRLIYLRRVSIIGAIRP
ncbi:MAG: hypothetical protein ACYC2R_08400 [Burkholderiales bacterium]